MRSQDLVKRRVMRDGVPYHVYINKRTGQQIATLSQRQLERLRMMNGEGIFSTLWDTAKKVVEVGKKVYDVAKPIYNGAKQGYDVYKSLSGKGIRPRGQFGGSVRSDFDGGYRAPGYRTHERLSKHINRSLTFQ